MRLYPAIDIMGGEVVRLTRGEANSRIAYNPDPVDQARRFAGAGATHIHVVDLDAAFRKGDNRATLARLVESTPLRVQTGGGIRSVEDLQRLFDLGVWRAVIGSAAVESPELVEEGVRRFGEHVCVGLDAEGGRLRIKGWTERADLSARDAARRMASLGVSTLVVTDIARDGMLDAPDIEGTVELARHSGCRVVVSGGVARLGDVERIARHPERDRIDGVIVGKAIYEGRVDVGEALAAIALTNERG